MGEETGAAPTHHLFIAGTGRSGTSFLVRYLTELGLETHLAAHPKPDWNDEAKAGLEDHWRSPVDGRRPYVMKSPWLYEFIDEILADPAVRIDAVIVPVRDLTEAAASRIQLQRHSMLRANPWIGEFERSWDHWGETPGGAVFSLDPVDQGRLLAAGFHHLVQRLVRAGVPLLLLDFPRLVQDPDYLFDALRSLLPPGATSAEACAAHARIAATFAPLGEDDVPASLADSSPASSAGPDEADRMDRRSLAREVARLRTILAGIEKDRAAAARTLASLDAEKAEALRQAKETHRQAEELVHRSDDLRARAEASEEQARFLRGQLAERGQELELAKSQSEARAQEAAQHFAQLARLAKEVEALRVAMAVNAETSEKLASATRELQEQSRAFEELKRRQAELQGLLEGLVRERSAILASRRWRMTQPLVNLVQAARALGISPGSKR